MKTATIKTPTRKASTWRHMVRDKASQACKGQPLLSWPLPTAHPSNFPSWEMLFTEMGDLYYPSERERGKKLPTWGPVSASCHARMAVLFGKRRRSRNHRMILTGAGELGGFGGA